MIPNIFISSTILDLSHLRDSIKDLITEIGYNPILSEYGDIGYLPSDSAEQSCYISLKDCQFAIFIIGQRYGSISQNGLSVTHNEFRIAKESGIPIIFLVNEEILSYKKVFEANINNSKIDFPNMENPTLTFNLIKEFSNSETNNGIVTYNNVQSAKQNLKKQLANIFGDLIKKHYNPTVSQIKDILSEITTLRHMLLKNEQEVAKKFTTAFRFLLNEENSYLKNLVEAIEGSLESGIPNLLISPNLTSYLKNKNIDYRIMNNEEAKNLLFLNHEEIFSVLGFISVSNGIFPHNSIYSTTSFDGDKGNDLKSDNLVDPSVIIALGSDKVWVNTNGSLLLEEMYKKFKNVSS